MYNNNYANQMGQMYQQVKQPAWTQPLSDEQIKMLQQNNSCFSLKVDPIETVKCQCTHKHKHSNTFALMPNPDDTVTCSICGATFRLLIDETLDVDEAVRNIEDIIQSIKTIYLDLPNDYAQHIPQVLPWIRKLPQLYKIGYGNFRKYESNNMLGPVNPYNGPTANTYNSIVNGMYNTNIPQSYNMGYNNYQAQMAMDPMMQQQYQQNMMYNQMAQYQQNVPNNQGYNPNAQQYMNNNYMVGNSPFVQQQYQQNVPNNQGYNPNAQQGVFTQQQALPNNQTTQNVTQKTTTTETIINKPGEEQSSYSVQQQKVFNV